MDKRGHIIAQGSIKTAAHKEINEYVTNLSSALQEVIDQVGGADNIKGIGVGAPNGNFYRLYRICSKPALERFNSFSSDVI